MNLIQIQDIRPHQVWNSFVAKKWWESDVNESRTGTFNMKLYFDILEFRSDPERVAEYYKQKGGKDV